MTKGWRGDDHARVDWWTAFRGQTPCQLLTFRDFSLEAGVGADAIGSDVNGDGWLDIYLAPYNRYGQVIPHSWFRATNGTPNLPFINMALFSTSLWPTLDCSSGIRS